MEGTGVGAEGLRARAVEGMRRIAKDDSFHRALHDQRYFLQGWKCSLEALATRVARSHTCLWSTGNVACAICTISF